MDKYFERLAAEEQLLMTRSEKAAFDFLETKQRHAQLFVDSGIFAKTFEDTSAIPLGAISTYRRAARSNGTYLEVGGMKISTVMSAEDGGIHVPVFRTDSKGLQPLGLYTFEDALLTASMVMELTTRVEDDQWPLTFDLTEIDVS